MLLKDFYKVISLEKQDGQIYSAMILINNEHEVFKGHFPSNPIMPGVCMMQIIKELTEQITEKTLVLKTLTNVKFMALINPDINPTLRLELQLTISNEDLKVKNTTYFNETVALKLSGVYKNS